MEMNQEALEEIRRWRDKYCWEHRIISKLALLKHGVSISKTALSRL